MAQSLAFLAGGWDLQIDPSPCCAWLHALIMATHHDTQNQGGGFWGCANLGLAIFFAGCAALAGGGLFFGGLTRPDKNAQAAAAPAPATAAAPAAASAAAPAPAAGGAAPAAAAPAASGDVVEITLKPGQANPMSYDTTTINAKPGQKVKLTFANQSSMAPLQHNLILCKPGTKDAIIAAANGMMTDMPKWMAKGFIPESPDVLHHTKLLNPGESETLEFTAGPAGDYPYLCTFPGHSIIMQGVLKVQ